MSEGWIKLHRKLMDNKIWLDEPFTRGQAWIDLIMLANHKVGYVRVAGQRMEIKRGQCGWSELKLSQRWKWSRNKVRRFMDELFCDGNIDRKTNTRTTIITICNYEEYQNSDTTDDTTDDTTERQQTIQQKDTNKNVKKEKKEKKEERITPPRILDKSKLLSPKTEKLSTMGKGLGFENNVLEGKGSFNIEHHLTDSDWQKVRGVAKGWDVHRLASVYNSGVKVRGVPKYPSRAFVAWCGKYTKGVVV